MSESYRNLPTRNMTSQMTNPTSTMKNMSPAVVESIYRFPPDKMFSRAASA